MQAQTYNRATVPDFNHWTF